MSQKVYAYIAIVILLMLSVAFFMTKKENSASLGSSNEKTIIIAGTPVTVEVVSTPALRELGLSGRSSLPEGSGMLFVFEKDQREGFWMKDMKFPIDIIWIDSTGKVVTVAPSLSPATYPNVFYPSSEARYVLEVPAGFAATHNLALGSEMKMPPL